MRARDSGVQIFGAQHALWRPRFGASSCVLATQTVESASFRATAAVNVAGYRPGHDFAAASPEPRSAAVWETERTLSSGGVGSRRLHCCCRDAAGVSSTSPARHSRRPAFGACTHIPTAVSFASFDRPQSVHRQPRACGAWRPCWLHFGWPGDGRSPNRGHGCRPLQPSGLLGVSLGGLGLLPSATRRGTRCPGHILSRWRPLHPSRRLLRRHGNVGRAGHGPGRRVHATWVRQPPLL